MSGLPGVEAGGRDVAACTANSGHRTAMDFVYGAEPGFLCTVDVPKRSLKQNLCLGGKSYSRSGMAWSLQLVLPLSQFQVHESCIGRGDLHAR